MIKRGFLFLLVVLMLSSIAGATEHVSREDAVAAIEDADQAVIEVMEIKNETGRLNDSLEEAKLRLNQATNAEYVRNASYGPAAADAERAMEGLNVDNYHYSDVLRHTREVQRLRDQLFNLTDRLRATRSQLDRYDERGLNVSKAADLIEEAETAYQEERYDDMDDTLIQANRALEESQSERSIGTVLASSGSNFISTYFKELLIGAFLVIVGGWFLNRFYVHRRLQKQYHYLERRREAIQDMMEETQEAYFVEDDLPKSVYEARMRTYRDQLAEVDEERATIADRLEIDED